MEINLLFKEASVTPDYVFETAVITAIEHYARDTTYETGSNDPAYQNRFEALPARLAATPYRATARSRIDGTQIALIAGPLGEEIHIDRFGRVKLWFPQSNLRPIGRRLL